jgi:hypothetical protein
MSSPMALTAALRLAALNMVFTASLTKPRSKSPGGRPNPS